jgi:hypothetical protein
MLKEFQDELLRTGKEIRLARMKRQVMDVIKRSELQKTIPMEHIYPSVQAGVDAFLSEFHLEEQAQVSHAASGV